MDTPLIKIQILHTHKYFMIPEEGRVLEVRTMRAPKQKLGRKVKCIRKPLPLTPSPPRKVSVSRESEGK
jgi:hypothetical protein